MQRLQAKAGHQDTSLRKRVWRSMYHHCGRRVWALGQPPTICLAVRRCQPSAIMCVAVHAAGSRCAAVHEQQQQQAAVHVLQSMSSSSRL
ncbi:hypothetical protein QJQ45_018913 [Haematococcus lacustris]|nr:hypothetical protein QJQ45_018913 [Haematococcus lacustris]